MSEEERHSERSSASNRGRAGAPEPASDASRGDAEIGRVRRPDPASGTGRSRRSSGGSLRSAGERLIGAGGLGIAALLLGVLGGVLLGLAEFLPILQVEVNGLPCPADFTVVEECEPTGGDRHSYGLVLLGLLVIVMSFGAGPGRSLPAAIALAVAALFAIGIAILADLQYVDDTGAVVTSTFEEAEATTAIGLWTELAGGALALLAAVAAVLQRRTHRPA